MWSSFLIARSPEFKPGLALPDKVAASPAAHFHRVHGAGRNVQAGAFTVSFRFSIPGEGHFAVQNQMRGLAGGRVIGIGSVRAVLPDVDVADSFFSQFSRPFPFVHCVMLAGRIFPYLLFHCRASPKNGNAPPAAMGAAAGRACRLQERRSLLWLGRKTERGVVSLTPGLALRPGVRRGRARDHPGHRFRRCSRTAR